MDSRTTSADDSFYWPEQDKGVGDGGSGKGVYSKHDWVIFVLTFVYSELCSAMSPYPVCSGIKMFSNHALFERTALQGAAYRPSIPLPSLCATH